VIATSGALERSDVRTVVDRAANRNIETIGVTAPVMAALSPVRAPSGIVAIAGRPRQHDQLYSSRSTLVVIACDIQDPGNLGAIVRVADAAGAAGVVVAGRAVDPYGWKALRGSMGSALRLPIAVHRTIDDAVMEARQRRYVIAAAVPRGGTPVFDADLTQPTAALIGGEGSGLPQEVVDAADLQISVPMEPRVESLNAAATAAVIVYEARRQRRLDVNADGLTLS
jgi:TrmH family RNA methyltransferase